VADCVHGGMWLVKLATLDAIEMDTLEQVITLSARRIAVN